MLKKLLALVLAGAMVIGSALPAMARTVKLLVKEDDTFDSEAKYYQLNDQGEYVELTLDSTSFGELQASDSKFFVDHDPTITIKSPVIGATYRAYKVFDLTLDEKILAYSYTIDTDSPFYEAVAEYAADPTNGLKLEEITTATTATYKKFNVTAATSDNPIEGYSNFDAQAFGQALEDKIIAGDITATFVEPTYETDKEVVTVATSGEITFEEGIDLGYYLILCGKGDGRYPVATGTVTVGEDDDPNKFTLTDAELEDEAAIETKVNNYVNATVVDTVPDGAPEGTKSYIQKKIDEAGATNSYGEPLTSADPEYAKFVQDLKDSLKADAMAKIDAAKAEYTAKKYDINVKSQRVVIVDSTNPDIRIEEKNQLDTWDIPTSPDGHADVGPDHGEPDGGKNIIIGYAQENEDGTIVEGTFQKTPEEGLVPVYADWTEANIGDSISYEIRVNAMNYVRDDTPADTDAANATTESNPETRPDSNDDFIDRQVKEYIIADYQNDALVFDPTKDEIWVSIVDDDGNIVKLPDIDPTTGEQKIDSETGDPMWIEQKWNYTTWHDSFFIPEGDVTKDASGNVTTIFSNNGGGIAIPWVVQTDDEEEAKKHKNYEYTVEPIWNDPPTNSDPKMVDKIDEYGDPVKEIVYTWKNGDTVLFTGTETNFKKQDNYLATATKEVVYEYVDPQNPETVSATPVDGYTRRAKEEVVKVQETTKHYFYSIYDSDVTIVVNYTMTINDKATIDVPGNINYSQYGVNFVQPDDYEYEATEPTNPNPDKPEKPDQEREVDDATVFTYALAIQKVDERGLDLAGAEFTINGITVKKMAEGFYKVLTYDSESTTPSEALKADKNGLLVVEGLTTDSELTITETKAPDGYNKLAAPITDYKATKVGAEVKTTATTNYYDAEGKATTKTDAKTRETIYYDADGNRLGKVVADTDGVTKYYGATDDVVYADEAAFNAALADTLAAIQGAALNDIDVSSEVEPYKYKVENKRGVELPSTGGIGTTIFYAGGAILVLLAGILLVSKRRFT